MTSTLTQLEEALLYLDKKELIRGMLYIHISDYVYFSFDLVVEQGIISFVTFIVRLMFITK